jgi:hypothetical protein
MMVGILGLIEMIHIGMRCIYELDLFDENNNVVGPSMERDMEEGDEVCGEGSEESEGDEEYGESSEENEEDVDEVSEHEEIG